MTTLAAGLFFQGSYLRPSGLKCGPIFQRDPQKVPQQTWEVCKWSMARFQAGKAGKESQSVLGEREGETTSVSSCKLEVKQVKLHEIKWSYFFLNICGIHMSWTVHMVHCNVSLGVAVNGGGNFINSKPTFNKSLCFLFLKQANWAMDFTQKVVSLSFFYFLLKCQIISHKFINLKYSRSAVWQHHRTKEHTLVQHLILCPELKPRVQPQKILFPSLCDKQAALHTRPLLEITRGLGL